MVAPLASAQRSSKKGPHRELNPGPLAIIKPKARIIRLDHTAFSLFPMLFREFCVVLGGLLASGGA